MSRNSQRSIYSKYKTYFSHTFAKVKNDPLLKLFLTLQFITVGPLWFWSAQFWIYFYVPFLRSDGRPNLTRTFCSTFLFSSSVGSGVGSNLQVGAQSKNFWCAPHFSLVPPHEGAQRLFVTDWETIELSPSVGSAVCTSTGEVGRGAIKVMGPSAVPCRLLGY